MLIDRLGQVPPPLANDGIVPFRSQLWGKLIWAGQGDHLDVVGHFAGSRRKDEHVDWLSSGARFDRARFDALLDAIAIGMLAAHARLGATPRGAGPGSSRRSCRCASRGSARAGGSRCPA